MKKIYFLLFFVMGAFGICTAQTVVFSSDFESWSGLYPSGWGGARTNLETDSISAYTASFHGGAQSCRLVNKESTHKRFTTTPMAVTNGNTYTITFWVRGHGRIRTNIYDERATGSGYGTYNAYIDINSSSWSLQSQDVVCANTSAIGEFIFSIQLTFADLDDLQIDDVTVTTGGAGTPALTITSPVNNGTVYTANPSITFTAANFVIGNPGTGIDGHISYTLDGGSAQPHYSTNPVALTGLVDGIHQVVMQLVDNSGNPLNPAVTATVSFTVNTSGPVVTAIHDIQYTTDPSGNSPFMDQTVTTAGIVTGFFASGYFIQSGIGQWNGIYVYDNQHQVAIGDSVIVSGTVKEYYNLTEISSITNFVLATTGNTVPSSEIINCATLNSEPYEGVLVKVLNVKCVNTSSGFGMWKIEDNSDTAKVHNLLYSYTPVLNTYYDITGPVYYSYDEYRIEPRNTNDVQVVTGIENIENIIKVNVYPNPVVDELNIESDNIISEVNIYDLSGQVLISESQDNKIFSIATEKLCQGTYLVEIKHSSGKTWNTKFVK